MDYSQLKTQKLNSLVELTKSRNGRKALCRQFREGMLGLFCVVYAARNRIALVSRRSEMRVWFSVVICALLVGCAAPRQPLRTASGNPEVSIQGVPRKQVLDKIVDGMAAKGLTIRTATDQQVVAGKRADDDFAARLLFGSRYDGVPEYRVTFTVVEQSSAVKVYARAAIVTNPGSAFERVNDLTDRQGQYLQDMLARLKTSVSSGASEQASATAAATPPLAQAPAVSIASKGKDTLQAQAVARSQSCAAQPEASMTANGPGFETYNVPCANGDTLTIRCEFGNCRALR